MIDLTFIIPVKNDADRLARCLASIQASQSRPSSTEIIVSDNGSTDRSREVASLAGSAVLDLPGRRVSELRNLAAQAARGRYFAFIDADHEIAPGWEAAAFQAMTDQEVGAAGALYSAPSNGTWVQRQYGVLRGQTAGRHDVGWLGSGNLVVRREAFEQVGGFDTSLEACEDVDFCKRLRASGWRIIADEQLRSIHAGDPPTLAALFRAERWRARNNVRVSLRPPVGLLDVVGLLTPVLMLAGLAGLAVSAIGGLAGRQTALLALVSVAMILAIVSAKTARAILRPGAANPRSLVRLFVVVCVYELARAVALVSPAGHHRR